MHSNTPALSSDAAPPWGRGSLHTVFGLLVVAAQQVGHAPDEADLFGKIIHGLLDVVITAGSVVPGMDSEINPRWAAGCVWWWFRSRVLSSSLSRLLRLNCGHVTFKQLGNESLILREMPSGNFEAFPVRLVWVGLSVAMV